jgi:hypothetical protein
VGTIRALIFEGDGVYYDLMIGHLALKKMLLHLAFHHEKTIWFENKVPFHSLDWFQDNATTIPSILQVPPLKFRGWKCLSQASLQYHSLNILQG